MAGVWAGAGFHADGGTGGPGGCRDGEITLSSAAVSKASFSSVVRLAEVDSTSDEAARRLRAGTMPVPGVVVADVQTRGRGTRGRTWLSDAAGGSLTATFVLPIHKERPVTELPLLAGLAVRDALAGLVPGADLRLKWPNDVLLGGRKAAGLLCERRDGADLVGVGVNLALDADSLSPELRGRVASLFEVAAVTRDAALSAVAARLAADVLPPTARLADRLADLRRHDALLGRFVAVATPGGLIEGECVGVDAAGCLLVRGASGVRRVMSGTFVSGAVGIAARPGPV